MKEIAVSCARNQARTTDASVSESINIWDLSSGTILHSFKHNSSDPNCSCFVGTDFIASVQNDHSTTLHFWTWKKNQVHLKASLPEKITSLAATNDGNFLIAGGLSGKLYLWSIPSGVLINSWTSHYKKVTCITVTDDDAFLISGGEDSTINVWNMASVMNIKSDSDNEVISPILSWSDHSLPITSLYCGRGGVTGRVVSTSVDRSCKIWDIPSKSLLGSIVFPSNIQCCIMDQLEQRLFVGGFDGTIYTIDLYSLYSICQESFNFSFNFQDNNKEHLQMFKGHTECITSLSVSQDGRMLASASLDGTCKLWDTQSHQLTRALSIHKGPVTCVRIIPKPFELELALDISLNASSNVNPNANSSLSDKSFIISRTLKPLKKFRTHNTTDSDTRSNDANFITVNLGLEFPRIQPVCPYLQVPGADMNIELRHSALGEPSIFQLAERSRSTEGSQTEQSDNKNIGRDLQSLKQQVQQLTEENQRWKRINNQIYNFALNQILQPQEEEPGKQQDGTSHENGRSPTAVQKKRKKSRT